MEPDILATAFTPWRSLAGGVLIGLAAVALMALHGRVAGVAGIVRGALTGPDRPWRVAFVTGLAAGPLAAALLGLSTEQSVSSNLPLMGLAGLAVGVGTALGSGCTSGHGVCGMARLSARSLVAVPVFLGVAAATVLVVRHGTGS